jgi:hypothetical protein
VGQAVSSPTLFPEALRSFRSRSRTVRGIASAHRRLRPLSTMHTSLAGAGVLPPGKDVAANHLPSHFPIHPGANEIRASRLFGYGSYLKSRENRLLAVDRRGFSRLSELLGHKRHGFACTTPLGPLTKTAFFAAPTLNRSLVVGSPPPACLSQMDSRSFSSTSWVTMCHRDGSETEPLGLTRLATISSPPMHGAGNSSHHLRKRITDGCDPIWRSG